MNIHRKNLHSLAIKIYKVKNVIASQIVKKIFELKKLL